MRDRLRISVSGIRGVVPGALNVAVVSRFLSAFGSYLETGKIGICRDTRRTSPMLEMAAVSAIVSTGLDCRLYGIVPTPLLQFAMRQEEFAGGAAITGGHNPDIWNAVLLLDPGGAYLDVSEGTEVFNLYESGHFQRAGWRTLGKAMDAAFPLQSYLESIGRFVDVARIRERKYRIVGDPCNGAASRLIHSFADHFGIELISLNDDPAKSFPHPPEPSEENASQVEAVVKTTKADIGFLLNSDSSRISFVTEEGWALSEEATFPLCLLALQGKISKAVTTVVTSNLADWAAKVSGISLCRTRVGQSSVVHTMMSEEAQVGGEGSGSLALRDFSSGYDSLLALALILDFLCREEKSLAEVAEGFPRASMKKIKVEVPPEKTYRVMERLEKTFENEPIDFTDGIRVDRKDVWFNIRPSLTEFVLRITIEGQKQKRVDEVEAELRERMGI
ncbi:MAG: hypothetical protein ACE5LV_06815 [Candidatus Aminicenantales bacterium]